MAIDRSDLYIVIHHTAIPEMQVQSMAIERSHSNRYEKSPYTNLHIVYHFLVGKDGTVKQNRALTERTTHTGCGLGETRCKDILHVNERSIAIALTGNFNVEDPTSMQIESLKSLLNSLKELYNISIISHQEASPTACPGKNLLDLLPILT